MRLPMLEDVRAQRTVVSSFGGYNHTPGVKENQFFDMVNMSSDEFPLLSPRKPYVHVRNVGYPGRCMPTTSCAGLRITASTMTGSGTAMRLTAVSWWGWGPM